jgi:hypothetical protein
LSHSYRHVLSSNQFGFDATILSNPTQPRQLRRAFAPPYIGLFGCTLLSENLPADNAMSSEATRHAPMMPLRELVDRYLSVAVSFGIPAALSSFALSPAETERLFSSYDEDYHISRFFHFSQDAGARFSINGFPATHVAIDAGIESIL